MATPGNDGSAAASGSGGAWTRQDEYGSPLLDTLDVTASRPPLGATPHSLESARCDAATHFKAN